MTKINLYSAFQEYFDPNKDDRVLAIEANIRNRNTMKLNFIIENPQQDAKIKELFREDEISTLADGARYVECDELELREALRDAKIEEYSPDTIKRISELGLVALATESPCFDEAQMCKKLEFLATQKLNAVKTQQPPLGGAATSA